MKSNALRALASCMFLASSATLAHDADESGKAKLGTVKFATSCDPKLQADFERAVAMLHSFWEPLPKAFTIFAKDPTCATAWVTRPYNRRSARRLGARGREEGSRPRRHG